MLVIMVDMRPTFSSISKTSESADISLICLKSWGEGRGRGWQRGE